MRVNAKRNESDDTVPMTLAVPPGKMAAAISPPEKSTISWTTGLGLAIAAINQGLAWTGHNPLPPETATVATEVILTAVTAFAFIKRTFYHA